MNNFAPWSAAEDWGDFFLDKTFTGRETELRLLEQHLLREPASAVAITAEPGMGKTTLALRFAHANKDFFSAGIYTVRATPFEPLPQAVDSTVSHPSQPYLLVLDDMESRPHYAVAAEIEEIRRSRPSARLLLLSRPNQVSLPADSIIRLGGMTLAEFNEFIEKNLATSPPGASLESLFGLVGGNAAAMNLVAELLREGRLTPRDIVTKLRAFAVSTIVGIDGRPLTRDSANERRIIVDLNAASEEVLRRVHREPHLVHELSPRQFEEFVAEVLSRLGYQVTLTPASKDGGKDICVAKNDHLGTFLYLVECKKYAPDNPVQVGLVRQLNGVVQAERATAGILATTSFFTRGAEEFQKRLANQITLKDYLGIQEWLGHIFRDDA